MTLTDRGNTTSVGKDIEDRDDDGTCNEAKANIQASGGAKSEAHTVGKQHTTSGGLGTKTISDESDQTIFDDYKKSQTQKPSKHTYI